MNNALLLLAACLGAFLFGVVSAFWGMVVPELEKKLGRAATILLANSLGLVIGSLVAGPLIDRAGNKLVLAAGVALVAAAIFGLGRVGSIGSGFVMAMMVGAGGSAIVTAANTLVAEITSDATRGLWSNITNNFFAVGAFIAPIVLARLIAGGATLKRIATLLAVIGAAVCLYYLLLSFP
ncbi:MAG: MFS transporter, partial [Anaerolineales bacterium]